MIKENPLVKAINKNVRTSPRKLALVVIFLKVKAMQLSDLEFTRKNCSRCKQNRNQQLQTQRTISV